MFDAEDVEGKRIGSHRDEAVFADDAVLLATANQFAGQEKQRALAAVDEDELIDGGSGGIARTDNAVATAAIAGHTFGALFADDDFAGGEALVKSEDGVGVMVVRTDYRENGEVFIADRFEETPISGWFARRDSGRMSGKDEA